MNYTPSLTVLDFSSGKTHSLTLDENTYVRTLNGKTRVPYKRATRRFVYSFMELLFKGNAVAQHRQFEYNFIRLLLAAKADVIETTHPLAHQGQLFKLPPQDIRDTPQDYILIGRLLLPRNEHGALEIPGLNPLFLEDLVDLSNGKKGTLERLFTRAAIEAAQERKENGSARPTLLSTEAARPAPPPAPRGQKRDNRLPRRRRKVHIPCYG